MQRQVPDQEHCSIPGTESIFVTETKIRYINTEYKKKGAKMYDHNCDVKLKVGDTSFKAHKDVLSEASDYFGAMFSHDMKEKEQGVVQLQEMSPAGFSVILDYFYHGHVTIDGNNVAHILEAARFFHIDWMITVCCEYIIRHLSFDDYEEAIHLAELFSLGNLKEGIFKFLAENLMKLTEDPNSSFFKKVSMELLSEFLRYDIYHDISEGFLVSIILQWVETDPEQRRSHLTPLLRLIRFPLIDLEDLETLPAPVTCNPEILDAVEEAKQFHYDIPGQVLKRGSKFMPRGAKPVVTVMAFNSEQNIILYKYPDKDDFYVEELSSAAAPEVHFETVGLATVGNFLFSVGGYDTTAISSKRLFRWDPKTRDWMELAMMNEPRISFAITSTDDRIFVLGGIDHFLNDEDANETDRILTSVEMYVAGDNTWITLPDLPCPMHSHAAAVVGENVYVCGGISGCELDPVPLGAGIRFSLSVASWEPIADMLFPRHSHSMTHHNGKLYVFGGYTSSNEQFVDCLENEVYDIETNQWSKIMTTPESFGHVFQDAAIVNNMLYFVSGMEENCFLHSYDIDADKIEEGILIGPFIKRFSTLQVAFPQGS